MRRARPLAAAGAPAAWARALARAAADASALRRASEWVPALAGVQPSLLARGGWDEGLAALAATLARRGGDRAPAARPPHRAAAADPFAFGASAAAAGEAMPRRAPRPRDAFDGVAARARARGPSGAAHPPFRSRPSAEAVAGDGEIARARSSSGAVHPPSRPSAEPMAGDGDAARGRGRRAAAHRSSRPPSTRRAGMADPATLPRQADAGLLHALAGRASVSPAAGDVSPAARGGGASPGAPSFAARRAISSLRQSPSARRPVEMNHTESSESSEDAARWIERAAGRAARGMTASPVHGDEGRAWDEAIAAEWDAPVAASPVTAEWLAGLAGLAAPRIAAEGAAATARRRTTGDGALAGRPSPEAVAGPSARDGSHRPAATVPWPVETAPPADAARADDAPAPHPADVARMGTVLPARLPSLPPARGEGHAAAASSVPPVPIPGAAAVRLPGAPDEGGAGEDLGELARRIKTILDDEARRFGIDV